MPRPRALIPAYCLHKTSGQAVCWINRKPKYLGRYNSPESRQAYSDLLRQLESGEQPGAKTAPAASPAMSVVEIIAKFLTDEIDRYSNAEQHCIRGVLTIALDLYGDTPADDFSPLRLRSVRDAMIAKGWSRSYVNKETARLKMVFRWAVSWGLMKQGTSAALATVPALRIGESEARETIPRRAVPDADIAAVRAQLSGVYRDLYDLLNLTGARPGELLMLTPEMIDRSGDVWKAELADHKTRHLGKSRTLYLADPAKPIILRHMKADPSAKLFPMRRETLTEAIKRACVKADVPVHTAHWIRHTVATKLADQLGTEFAQRALGHSSQSTTMRYSTAAEVKAIEAVKSLKIG